MAMGKKGGWISALKRVFTSAPKDKKLIVAAPDRESDKDKKRWAMGKLKDGGTKPFVLLNKEPSSIEKILGDAEREHQSLRHHPQSRQIALHQHRNGGTFGGTAEHYRLLQRHPQIPPKAPQHKVPETAVGSSGKEHQKLPSHANFHEQDLQHQSSTKAIGGHARVAGREPTKSPPLPPQGAQQRPRAWSSAAAADAPSTQAATHSRTSLHRNSAIRIQAAYRGYMVRKSYRALRSLVRLQRMMRGQDVKRQRKDALHLMQLFVKLQREVRTRRIQAMGQRSMPKYYDRENDGSISRWSLSHKSDAEEQNQEVWDGSRLTRKEINARAQRKAEAIMKRERALAYVTSNQRGQSQPKSLHEDPAELGSGKAPVWWGWLDRHFQSRRLPERAATSLTKAVPPSTAAGNRGEDAPMRNSSRDNRSKLGHGNSDAATKARTRPSSLVPHRHSPSSGAVTGRRDDESLVSCPEFTLPSYMAPTLSAKAKVREQPFLREEPPPAKRRFSFGLSQSIRAMRWGNGSSLMPAKEENARTMTRGKHRPLHSMGNLSVDSTTSMPAGVGRRTFYMSSQGILR